MISTPPHATRHHPGHLQPQPDLILMIALPFRSPNPIGPNPIEAYRILLQPLRSPISACAHVWSIAHQV